MLQYVLVLGSVDAEDKAATQRALNALKTRLEGVNRRLWVVVTTEHCGVSFHASDWANKMGVNRVGFPPSYGQSPAEGRACAQDRDAVLCGVVRVDLIYAFPGAEAQVRRILAGSPYEVPVVEAGRLDETFDNLFRGQRIEDAVEVAEPDEEPEDLL